MKTKYSKFSLAITIAFIIAISVSVPSHLAVAQSSAINSAQNTLTHLLRSSQTSRSSRRKHHQPTRHTKHCGTQLTKAQYAQSQGDTSSANTYAQQVQSTLNAFVQEANTLRDTAAQQTQTSFLINVVASIAGTFAVIGGSVAVWIIQKRKNTVKETQEIVAT